MKYVGTGRDSAMARLVSEHFDVLVIGGGITGAGIALDAATRGLRAALVDRGDLASGTSSRSSKLVHGGLRYLRQREFALVGQNLAERQRLLRNAPHLVRPVPFVIPLLSPLGARLGLADRMLAGGWSAALWGYDLAGGFRIGSRHLRLTAQEVVARLPGVAPDLVAGGFVYQDAQADDARLTLAVARTAIDQGAVVVTHAPVTSLVKGRYGRVAGAGLAGGSTVLADAVVNATGVWADGLRSLDGDPAPPCLAPARGAHLTLPRDRLAWTSAAVVPGGGGRSVFVVPWGDQVYIGTTDTVHHGPLDDPRCSSAEVDYLLAAVNAVLTEPLRRRDVVATWAGLRPLVAGSPLSAAGPATADLSRRHRVAVSPSGMVTVIGGKLTTYRAMAADAVDVVGRQLRRGARRSGTARLALHGAAGTSALRGDGAAARLGVPPEVLDHLVGRHGGEAAELVKLVAADVRLGRPLVAGQPYLAVEAVWAARHELAHTLDDVLSRRTRASVLGAEAAARAAPAVAALVGGELGWSAARECEEVAAFRAGVEQERLSAGRDPVPVLVPR
ncbi:MAG: glycerol-3-phosphate dehydrogenase/oxidase [Acidimicrobiales bacterium]